jgi:YidC/Oxa1 family membrane protein insertase
MDTKRLILFVIFSFSLLMLWDAWQQHNLPESAVASAELQDAGIPDAPKLDTLAADSQPDLPRVGGFTLEKGQRIRIETDLYRGEIDTIGGDLRRLELRQHLTDDKQSEYVLLDDQAAPLLYVAQTGLIGGNLPNHRSTFTSKSDSYQMSADSNELEVRLSWNSDAGFQVDKVYIFKRDSYAIDVRYEIVNNSESVITPSVYYQILHDDKSNQSSFMMPTFTGGAYYTDTDKFKKISFGDMAKGNLSKNSRDGWVGLVQHYFLGAWIPQEGIAREFYTKQLTTDVYSIGSVSALGQLEPGYKAETTAKLYAGPQIQSQLKAVAPGLEYAVDYGWLTIIAAPLFWVLSTIQKFVGNWGVSIILLTILIKLAFYPLSAASYRSMAHLRELTPRLQSMKEKFGDDRQKLQQAMMELYKTEKINPLGGCLPILVQIPVFIALYWVLLGSVEMRHAPFMLWIQDLSATDPYFVLPILMGLTMIVQTKLNPKPTDPVQAKVMMIMPIVFSVFFFFFPAGLVLYWLVNNILSIAQQWHINRVTERETAKKRAGKR